jgi:hypothetical protein
VRLGGRAGRIRDCHGITFWNELIGIVADSV